MKRFRITPMAKVLIVILVLSLLGSGVFFCAKNGLISNDIANKSNVSASSSAAQPATSTAKDTTAAPATPTSTSDEINLSLDEWIGWESILTANGGLTTQPGSVFDQLGIKVNVNIINDASESSNALISGDLQAAGYTTNRVAFLSDKFKQAGKNVIMPVFTNYSNGGDGIIASDKFASIESWTGAKIGVPEFSEAETLVAWFVDKSDLSDADKQTIMSNLIMFGTPDEAAKAFFAGQIDIAATWEPYLSQAEDSTNSVVVFDTTASSTLIMDGIVFDSDWSNAHKDTVAKFVDGVIQASTMAPDYNAIRTVMPMYSTASDEDINTDCGNAKMATWADNEQILKETAPMIYNDMCDIWESLGETVVRDMSASLFDVSYVESLSDKYKSVSSVSSKTEITAEQKQTAQDYTALLTKTSTVNFVSDTAKFIDQAEAASVLNEFVDIANVLDGTIIQIEGNINAAGEATDSGVKLSYNRAQTVANYLVSQGVPADRIVIIGNGNSKMTGDPNTDDGRVMNRRVDVMFKTVED